MVERGRVGPAVTQIASSRTATKTADSHFGAGVICTEQASALQVTALDENDQGELRGLPSLKPSDLGEPALRGAVPLLQQSVTSRLYETVLGPGQVHVPSGLRRSAACPRASVVPQFPACIAGIEPGVPLTRCCALAGERLLIQCARAGRR